MSLGVFGAINPVNMSILPPAVLGSKCGKNAHINVYEFCCLSVSRPTHVQRVYKGRLGARAFSAPMTMLFPASAPKFVRYCANEP